MSGALVLAYTWQQSIMPFAVAGGILIFSLLISRSTVVNPTRFLGAIAGCAVVTWMGANMMTSSTRFDAQGVTVQAPMRPLTSRGFIAWKDMAVVEIVPCGWNSQGLRLVSRTGAELVIPLDDLWTRDVAAIVARVAAHSSVRMLPDAQTLLAEARRIVPKSRSPKLQVSVIPDRLAAAR